MTASLNLKTSNPQWNKNLRYKATDVVIYNNTVYHNLTGVNSEPSSGSSDWYSEPSELTEKKINGFWFDTEGNVDLNSIEIGNPFRGFNGDNYVVGKVIDLPFDVSDETKVSLAVSNEIINL